VRGFEERARDVFERSVDRKKNERRVNVREHKNHGEGAVEKSGNGLVSDVEILKRAVEDAVGAEDSFPCVAADEIADPERDDDELVEKLFAGARVKGKKVSERISEKE
jgi:hypothetical protein